MDKQGETTKRGISGDSQPVAKVQIPPALWLCIECAAIYAKELSNTRERSVTPNARSQIQICAPATHHITRPIHDHRTVENSPTSPKPS